MNYLPDKIRLTCEKLREMANVKIRDLDNLEYVKAPGYKKNNTPPAEGWQPVTPGLHVTGRDEHYWFRCRFHTPEARENVSYYARHITGLETEWDATFPQGMIFLNGVLTQACDGHHTEIYLEPDTEYDFCDYFYIGMEDGWVPLQLTLHSLDERAERLYYDMDVAYESCMTLNPNSEDYIALMGVLEQTANRIDFRSPQSFHASVEAAMTYIERELYEKLCTTEGKPVVDCVGHTHIDIEWLWHRDQTREKIQRSYANISVLMKKYPEFRFMLSQPELYRYLREEAPDKYAELQQYVKEGRWEPEGAMYVEADCNLISGESIVRQILQGKKFFKDEFGVDSRILVLPDVFGYSCALPQILRKSGVDYFLTSKISWNDTNTIPVDRFLWQGLDGTEIFTDFITTQEYEGPEFQRTTAYVGTLTPSTIKGTWNRFQQKAYGSHALTTYGRGDGGGGPTKTMLENQRRLARGLPGMPVTRMETLTEHFQRAEQEFNAACARTGRTPRWVGELYLEFHRGTYTSMGRNKRGNRKSEFLLQKAELLSGLDSLFGGSYDAKGLRDTWNLVLHDQFHDILPGSSIKEVYDFTDGDYARIRDYCQRVIDEKLRSLSEKIATDGGYLVCNSLGFARGGMVTIDGKNAELTEAVPAFGWAVEKQFRRDTDVVLEGLTAENRCYRMTLDEAGRIVSLFDKRENREVFKGLGNEIQVFEDIPRLYDNWNLSEYYKSKQWTLDSPARITPVTDGSRAGFRVERTYLDSRMVQHIWLYSESPRIDFEHDIDWHEHHQLVKAAFPLDVHAGEATCEIQFGHIRRPTHSNTSWEQAKYEVYGHKWVDLSDNGYGVSLLNDCKYGYSTEGSTLKLTLLRCGTYPNPEADQGRHRFVYSLLPHAGDFREAGVIQEAYALNQPLTVTRQQPASGPLPERFGLTDCSSANVVLETVKQAEDGSGLILRAYEAFDRRTNASVRVPEGVKSVWICDLMENPLERLTVENGTVTVPFRNFEIHTLKFVR